jgi:hypothetical protein
MKHSLLFLSFVLWLAALPSQASGKDLIEDLLEGVVDSFGEKLSDKVDEGLDKVFDGLAGKRQSPKSVTQDAGYCQVWEGGTLSVQEACHSEYSCKGDGTCVNLYVWPNGGATHVFWQDGAPRELNGKPTTYVLVGTDNCLVDAPSDVFCFTRIPQEAKIVIAEEEVQPEDVPPVAYTPEKVEKEPKPASNLNSLFDQYAVLADNLEDTSPETVSKRCTVGLAIIGGHAESLDAEMKSLIQEQLKRDKCLG